MSAGAEAKDKQAKDKVSLKEAIGVCAFFLVLFFTFRAFAFQQFHIPSGSMKPTLLVGDVLAVAKYTYGYSRYSLPLSLPLFSGRILAAPAARGDVVVFRLPQNPSEDLIKRIVGLPGDRVQMIGGVLHLNGAPVRRERLDDTVDAEEVPGQTVVVQRWRETLPNGVSYLTFKLFDGDGDFDDTEVFEVPAGHYFMMGDNRDGSTDSRSDVGYVPFENIVGQAKIIYFSIGDGIPAWQVWKWPSAIRYSRLFTTIR